MAKLSEMKRTGYKVCCTSHQIEKEEAGQLQASEKHICDICGSHGSECWCYDLLRCDTIEFDQHARGNAASLFRVEDVEQPNESLAYL